MLTRIKELIKKNKKVFQMARDTYAILVGTAGILKGKKGAGEHLKATFSLIKRSSEISGLPINITVEPTNQCNCHCPICETGAGILGRLAQHMSLEDFKTIIDKIAEHTNTLMFYFMGEPFINPQSYAMIRYAKDKGIPFITTCTNGDPVNPAKLVESGIDEISFQIGGITQETHGIYRVGSKIDRVVSNIRETVRLRNEKNVKMRIVCGFILMKHNETEVEDFKVLMKDLGVDEAMIIDPCVRTMEEGYIYLPSDKNHWIYDVDAFQQGKLVPKILAQNECPWMYYSVTIQVNGDVVPCCRDPHGQFVMGNILEQDLKDIWNNPKFIKFRTMVNHNQKNLVICRLCSGYGVSAIK